MNIFTLTWEWIRASGISSYFLLFLSLLAGILYRAKMFPKKHLGVLLIFHQACGWFGFLIGLFHGIMTVVDDYISYTLLDLFIPFKSEYQPILTGIGTLSLYALLLILLTSDLQRKIGKNIWKAVHIFAYPGYFLGLAHGIFLGTDTGNFWMIIFYLSTLVIIASVFFISSLTKTS